MAFIIEVDGSLHSVDGDTPLRWVLRELLGTTGTKFGRGMAPCGTCAVLS